MMNLFNASKNTQNNWIAQKTTTNFEEVNFIKNL